MHFGLSLAVDVRPFARRQVRLFIAAWLFALATSATFACDARGDEPRKSRFIVDAGGARVNEQLIGCAVGPDDVTLMVRTTKKVWALDLSKGRPVGINYWTAAEVNLPAGRKVIAATSNDTATCGLNRIMQYPRDGKPDPLAFSLGSSEPHSVAAARDNKWCVLDDRGNVWHQTKPATLESTFTLPGHWGQLCLSSNARYAARLTPQSHLVVYDIAREHEVFKAVLDRGTSYTLIELTNDGQPLLAAYMRFPDSSWKHVIVVPTVDEYHLFEQRGDNSVVLSDNGQYMAFSRSKNRICVVDLSVPVELLEWESQSDEVRCRALSSDLKYLVSSDDESTTLHIWDMDTVSGALSALDEETPIMHLWKTANEGGKDSFQAMRLLIHRRAETVQYFSGKLAVASDKPGLAALLNSLGSAKFQERELASDQMVDVLLWMSPDVIDKVNELRDVEVRSRVRLLLDSTVVKRRAQRAHHLLLSIDTAEAKRLAARIVRPETP